RGVEADGGLDLQDAQRPAALGLLGNGASRVETGGRDPGRSAGEERSTTDHGHSPPRGWRGRGRSRATAGQARAEACPAASSRYGTTEAVGILAGRLPYDGARLLVVPQRHEAGMP